VLIGAHESAAGGYANAVSRAREDGCESFQLFTAAPGRWSMASEAPGAKAFREACAASGLGAFLVHAPYLVNIASPDDPLWEKSAAALVADYRRAAALGAAGLVLHPGSHRGAGGEEGVRRAAAALSRLFAEVPDPPGGPLLLLENTAGSGGSLGASFAQLSAIRAGVSSPDRVGYCLDTAHLFAAGYDLRTAGAFADSLARVDGEAGLAPVRAFHLNDSARPLGSGIDRHERIGEGLIGVGGFQALLRDPRFAALPAAIETVPDPVGRYRPQLDLLRSLREGGAG
jgi:deoxyribonuclease-4